ncbi:5-hydroxytryptamine receptor 3A-like isoform X2 [Dunckerocampus dactyliophorus]|uniref:5-hydroxytryptamine receptor 3A-like isoform X2 n=1 Tax=Dunckerocampus dactyliophorus TaxID=161453 RepID=UPI0024059AAD|nr:5-hydroxytryptamine receptor 3A-like isoform X2 [Dunckerocampus dactyliophorus]
MPMSLTIRCSLWRAMLLWTLLTVGGSYAETNCTTRRCLADMLVNKKLITQPQRDNCTQFIYVSSIEYQTIKVDTKNLRLNCRLQAIVEWTDDDLYWDQSIYAYDEVILPVNKVWTPEIHIANGISASTQNGFRDLLAFSNGTLRHRLVMTASINCEFNLFNYPFAEDECPVAIQAWSTQGCGTHMEIGTVTVFDGSHGDWETLGAYLHSPSYDRYFISVVLKIRQQNPFITLLLPSILLILADMVSFALPLGGGERNSFKVTLVLSFTMFLLILNDQLPGDSECSPVIKNHFCVCLVMLVISMLVSMVLTRVARDGGIIFCCCRRGPEPGSNQDKAGQVKADISVIQLNDSEDNQMLKKVVDFLEAMKAKELETGKNEIYADKIDKAFFWFYFILGALYFCAMITVMVKYNCQVNHLDFW